MSKKRIKKFLKRVAPLALAGFGAAMLGRRNQMKDFLATEGGDRSNITSKPNMMDIAGSIVRPRRSSILAKPNINKMDLSEVDLDFVAPSTDRFRNMDMGLQGYMPMKKGGRARKRKGFAKKKKQANKMRKK